MANFFQYLSVSEQEFFALLESNNFACNAAGRAFMAEHVQVLRPRPLKAISSYMFKEAEKLGGIEPGMTFEYPNAQSGKSVARVCSLYELPANMKNPYLYVFSGMMTAPFYGFEILRFYYKRTKQLLPFISSGKEGNKGLFRDVFYRDTHALIHKTEYDSYYAIMSQLADKKWVYANYTPCDDDDTAGNLVELYEFAKGKGMSEITFVICSGNPFYDKRLLAEWMLQLKDEKFKDVKINLVLCHCPLFYTSQWQAVPEARLTEIFLGYIAASIGPLAKDTVDFNGKTESERPERYLMPGVKGANWGLFRNVIVDHSNMGWPNYQEILYGIDHKTAVANIILSDLFARASFTAKDYDNGIWGHITRYQRFLGGAYDPGKQSFGDYLEATTDKRYF